MYVRMSTSTEMVKSAYKSSGPYRWFCSVKQPGGSISSLPWMGMLVHGRVTTSFTYKFTGTHVHPGVVRGLAQEYNTTQCLRPARTGTQTTWSADKWINQLLLREYTVWPKQTNQPPWSKLEPGPQRVNHYSSLLRRRSYGFVTQSFLGEEWLRDEPVRTSA